MMAGGLARSFRKWADWTARTLDHREIVATALRRIMQRGLSAAFNTWCVLALCYVCNKETHLETW